MLGSRTLFLVLGIFFLHIYCRVLPSLTSPDVSQASRITPSIITGFFPHPGALLEHLHIDPTEFLPFRSSPSQTGVLHFHILDFYNASGADFFCVLLAGPISAAFSSFETLACMRCFSVLVLPSMSKEGSK